MHKLKGKPNQRSITSTLHRNGIYDHIFYFLFFIFFKWKFFYLTSGPKNRHSASRKHDRECRHFVATSLHLDVINKVGTCGESNINTSRGNPLFFSSLVKRKSRQYPEELNWRSRQPNQNDNKTKKRLMQATRTNYFVLLTTE